MKRSYNQMTSAYVCDYPGCEKYLKTPVTLPCGDSICAQHVSEHFETELDHVSAYQCQTCHEECPVPRNGFKVNKKLEQQLNENSHLSGTQKLVKEKIDALEKSIEDKQKTHPAVPDQLISELCSKLRNEIEFHRDQMTEHIIGRSKELINKVNTFETDCNQNEAKPGKLNLINKKELFQLKEKLRNPQVEEKELKELNTNVELINREVETKSRLHKMQSLMNKDIYFEPFDNKSFGNIVIKQVDIQSEGPVLNDSSVKLVKTFTDQNKRFKSSEAIENSNKNVSFSNEVMVLESGQFENNQLFKAFCSGRPLGFGFHLPKKN
jgi:hypothetical protein